MNNRLIHDRLPLAEIVIAIIVGVLLWCAPFI